MTCETEEELITAVETPRGLIYLQRRCRCDLIENLAIDSGIGAFFRYNEGSTERQRELFMGIAANDDEEVLLVHTQEGVIVGGITVLHPGPHEHWGKLGDHRIYEMGSIEVSANWRGLGIAKKMMDFLFANGFYEDKIVYSMELAWHWDFKHSNLTKFEYRDMLLVLFESAGFVLLDTDDPDICMDSANMLTVRIGKDVDQELRDKFWYSLFERGDYRWGF
jgi:acetoin utilization protein AcuA